MSLESSYYIAVIFCNYINF